MDGKVEAERKRDEKRDGESHVDQEREGGGRGGERAEVMVLTHGHRAGLQYVQSAKSLPQCVPLTKAELMNSSA